MTSPPHAIPCWADDTHFYMLPPGTDKPIAFSLGGGGMSRALPFLRTGFKAPPPKPKPVPIPPASSALCRSVLRNLRMMG